MTRQNPSPVDPAGDPLGFDIPPPGRLSRGRAAVLVSLVALVLGAAFLVGWLPRRRTKDALILDTKARAGDVLKVQVVTPQVKSSSLSLVLPGTIRPLEETIIYPRADGYVRAWRVDIGDKVEANALLAEIDTPELDEQLAQAGAQLAQAEAQLAQAEANRQFSNTTLQRYKELAPKGVASQQELDKQSAQSLVDEANVSVAKATIAAQRANVRRLTQAKSFARVVAPFGGTVNARMIERGALVSPRSPLFRISATDPVRVFVDIPQDVAPTVRPDLPAKVTLREYAGRVFEGSIARTAGALDPASRTMTTEIRVPNPKGELLAGMYAQASLTLPSPHRVVEVPPTAIFDDANGTRVAIVDADSKIHLVPIVIERDTGANIEVSSGLSGTERVVRLVNADVTEGRSVTIVP